MNFYRQSKTYRATINNGEKEARLLEVLIFYCVVIE